MLCKFNMILLLKKSFSFTYKFKDVKFGVKKWMSNKKESAKKAVEIKQKKHLMFQKSHVLEFFTAVFFVWKRLCKSSNISFFCNTRRETHVSRIL